MQSTNEMQQGWDFAAEIMGADFAAHMGQGYVRQIEAVIKELENNINDHQYKNLGVKQLQGYMLEEWAAGTFNVDAVAADSTDHATVLHSLAKDSSDIQLKSGEAYSAKSYADAGKTAKAQAKFNADAGRASYRDQSRLVPSDQLSEAKNVAHREALRNQSIRPEISDAYAETEAKLTDTVKNDKGVTSKGISRQELEDVASESKDQKFHAEDHGISPDTAIKTKYLLKQALKAGYTAAAITIAIQLAPEIFKAIDYLIKHGQIDIQQVKRVGSKGISAGGESFLRGAAASALLITCERGKLGEAFKGLNPTALGVVTTVVIQTIKNSILVAAGKMSAQQMGTAFADTVIVSGGYFLGEKIGGLIGQAIGGGLPVLGYLLGSLVGTAFCVLYNIGKKRLISFCVDTGFTCFGLVEQDYELPEEVLHELGVETIPIPRTPIERAAIPKANIPTANVEKLQYETIDMTVWRRGVIGVNKIGYTFS